MRRFVFVLAILTFFAAFGTLAFYSIFRLNLTAISDEEKPLAEEGGQQSLIERHRRWKRKSFPVDNIQVYATNSNVSVADQVQVLSAESRIQISEAMCNVTFWSNSSLLLFDLEENEAGSEHELIGLSASNAVAVHASVNGAELEGSSDILQFNSSTSRGDGSDDEDTIFVLQMTGEDVNFSLADAQISSKIRASGGVLAFVSGQTWTNTSVKPHLSVVSALKSNDSTTTAANGQRELSIAARSQRYELQIRLEGSKLELFFFGTRVNISEDHKTVVLRTQDGHYRISIQTIGSPLEVLVEDNMIRVNCFEENTVLEVPTPTDDKMPLILTAGQLTKLFANRTSAFSAPRLRVNGGTSITVDNVELVARQLRLYLSTDQTSASSILVDSAHSQLRLQHSNQSIPTTKPPMITATFTAVRHLLEILGSEPLLVLQTGNLFFTIQSLENGTNNEGNIETSILPQELVGTLESGDYLRIGPLANGLRGDGKLPQANNRTPPGWLSLDEWSRLVGQQQFATTPLAGGRGGFSQQVEEADKLSKFYRTSLLTSPGTTTPVSSLGSTPASATTAMAESEMILAVKYPTPSEPIFTFSPTEVQTAKETVEIRPTHIVGATNIEASSGSDFVVAHFDTTTQIIEPFNTLSATNKTISEQMPTFAETETTATPFLHPFPHLVSSTETASFDRSSLVPILATIVAIEMPNTTSSSMDINEFKGIAMENRVDQTIEVSTKGRELREIILPALEKRQEKSEQLIELDVTMDSRGAEEEKELPLVKLKVGLEKSINQILSGILGASANSYEESESSKKLLRDRREPQIRPKIIEDSEETGISKPVHVHIRKVEKISPEQSTEKVYRVRFNAEANGKKQPENSSLAELIVRELNRLGVEKLSKEMNNLKVLSLLRIYYDTGAIGRTSSESSANALDWTTSSRVLGLCIFIAAFGAAFWALLILKNRTGICSFVRMRSPEVSGRAGVF